MMYQTKDLESAGICKDVPDKGQMHLEEYNKASPQDGLIIMSFYLKKGW